MDFIPDSEDGVCIDLMTVGANNTFVGPFWLDSVCNGQTGRCACDEYPESVIIWDEDSCQGWEGSSDMALIIGTERWVTDIPTNVQALQITLSADTDFDLQLYYGTKTEKESSPCLIGYDCIQDTTGIPKIWPEYDNMQTIFSGDDRSAPVTETIQIVDTRVPLSLWVRSYGKHNTFELNLKRQLIVFHFFDYKTAQLSLFRLDTIAC